MISAVSARDGTIRQVRRIPHDGGNLTYEVDMLTGDGELRRYVLRGNVFVGPVLLFTDDGREGGVAIHQPRRFGEFAGQRWVHRFFAEWRADDGHTERITDGAADWLTLS